MAQSDLDDRDRLQLESVRAASELLVRLLQDAHALARGENLDRMRRAEPTDVARLVARMERRWQAEIADERLRVEVDGALPAVAMIDRLGVERVLSNFVRNAQNHGGGAPILVHVSCNSDGWLVFAVRDGGPGFSAELLDGLLPDEAPGIDKRGALGSGYGLRIAQNLAVRMDGHVGLRNLDGGGAEVALSLAPEVWRPGGATPMDRAQGDVLRLDGKTILVAEDSTTQQIVTTALLQELGATVSSVSSGEEAVALFNADAAPVYAALIDIDMPGMGGLEAIRRMRAHCVEIDEPGLPIIALTGYSDSTDHDTILAAGASAIITKPATSAHTIGAAITHARNEALGLVAGEAAPILHPERFRHILDIASLTGADTLVTQLMDDLTAIQRACRQAADAQDLGALGRQGHKLSSLAATIGADGIAQQAERITRAAKRDSWATMERHCAELDIHLAALIAAIEKENKLRVGPA